MNNGYCNEDLCIFMIMSLRILLRMRNVSDKSCRGNQNTYFTVSNFPPENRAIYEIMWEKYCRARQATDGNKIQHIYEGRSESNAFYLFPWKLQ